MSPILHSVARKAGAREVIHSGRESVHERLEEMTDGHGPDVVIEAIGRPETFRAAVEEVAYAGRVVYIGYAKEPVSYETRQFVLKELDIVGSRNALPRDFEEVIRMFEGRRFPAAEAIGATPDPFIQAQIAQIAERRPPGTAVS